MLRRFTFRPDATEILLAIASTVALAGGTLFVLLFALLGSGRLTAGAPLTLPTGGTTWVLVVAAGAAVLAALALWRVSARHTPPAAPLLRATYALGMALVIGWWVGTLGFGALFWFATAP